MAQMTFELEERPETKRPAFSLDDQIRAYEESLSGLSLAQLHADAAHLFGAILPSRNRLRLVICAEIQSRPKSYQPISTRNGYSRIADRAPVNPFIVAFKAGDVDYWHCLDGCLPGGIANPEAARTAPRRGCAKEPEPATLPAFTLPGTPPGLIQLEE